MKKKKWIFLGLLLLMLCGVGLLPGTRAEAATLTNVMKAPKAKKGKWVATSKGRRYKYTSTGKYARNAWLKINGHIYYFTSKGYAKTGWKTWQSRYYYFNSKGKLQTGWLKTGTSVYYLWKNKGKLSGSAAVGKVKISSSWYYFSKKGVMQTGWKKISGAYYYFDPTTGKMAVNTTVDGYQVDKSGKRVESGSVSSDSTTSTKTGKVDYWVGDSRTVGLCSVKKIQSKSIALVGAGYSWYVSTAEAKLKKKLNKDPDATVVINFGVNDVGNISKYIKRYKKLIKAYPEAHIYFMSVNPIDSKYTAGYVSNAKIKAFNKKLKAAFSDRYIDTYSYLKKNGFNTVDGLHYTSATYKKIYNYVLKKV